MPSDQRDEADEVRILPQQREQRAPPCSPAEEAVEARQVPHRDFRARANWSMQHRHQLGEIVRAPARPAASGSRRRASDAPTRRHFAAAAGSPSRRGWSSVSLSSSGVEKERSCCSARGPPGARLEQPWRSGAAPCAEWEQQGFGERVAVGESRESARIARARRDRPAACGSARRRPSAGGARRGAGSDRPRRDRRARRRRSSRRSASVVERGERLRGRAARDGGRRRSAAASARRIRSRGCRRGRA